MSWSSGGTTAYSELSDGTKRTGAIIENFRRYTSTGNAAALTLGTIFMAGIDLPAGRTIASVSFVSGTQALVQGGANHLWAGLCDSSRVVKAVTADDTSPVWAANSEKTFTFASSFITTYSGLHYVFLCNASAGTAPSLNCGTLSAVISTLAPILQGTSSAGQTTPPTVSTTLGAITAQTAAPYCWVA